MNLGDYKQAVRGLLQDDQFDEDLITQALNWFVYELFNNTRTRLMEESDTITASAGDTTVDFPSDLMTRISLWATVPDVYQLDDNELEYGDFMRSHAGFATSTASRAGKWTTFGNAIRLAAPLNADHTFQIDYLREPIPMENDSDECEVPDRYSELVAKGALARVMEINEDYAEAAQERQNLDPLLTTFIRNEARGGGKTRPTVIRTRRGRNYGRGATPRLGE